jgi:hypothetical protein
VKHEVLQLDFKTRSLDRTVEEYRKLMVVSQNKKESCLKNTNIVGFN